MGNAAGFGAGLDATRTQGRSDAKVPRRVHPVTFFLFCVLTFGIYGVVKFYAVGGYYERTAGLRTQFKTWLAVVVLSQLLLKRLNSSLTASDESLGLEAILVLVLVELLVALCALMALNAFLQARESAVRLLEIPSARLAPWKKHMVLLGVGHIVPALAEFWSAEGEELLYLSIVLVGFTALLWQAKLFICDYNHIHDEVQKQQRGLVSAPVIPR